jgi:hypothetical protein
VTSAESLSSPRVSDAAALEDPAKALAALDVAASRERVCHTLRRMLGPAAVLIVTRGFRDMLASNYAQYVRAGGRLHPRELYAPHAEQLATFLDYDAVIALYEATFGAEQVIVLPYELLREDAAAFVGEIERPLGLEAGNLAPPNLNRAPSPASLHWYRSFSHVAARLAALLGPRLGRRAYALYVGLIFQDRLHRPASLLHGIFPGRELSAADVPDEVVEACRGRAAQLGHRRLHARYAEAYLNAPASPEKATPSEPRR